MIGGLAMAVRTADKARAASAGTLGSFNYDCSIDNKSFASARIDVSEYLAAVTSSPDDLGAEGLLVRKMAGKSDDEVAAYNRVILE